jgi:hypothetical protein
MRAPVHRFLHHSRQPLLALGQYHVPLSRASSFKTSRQLIKQEKPRSQFTLITELLSKHNPLHVGTKVRWNQFCPRPTTAATQSKEFLMKYIFFSCIRPLARLVTLCHSQFSYYLRNDEGRSPQPLIGSATIPNTEIFTSVARWVWLLAILLSCSTGSLQAQDDSNPNRGFYPGGSYAIGEIETINRADGNLFLNVPLASLPAGRGGMSATLNLNYNNKLWDATSYPVYNEHPDYDQLLYTEHLLERGQTGG